MTCRSDACNQGRRECPTPGYCSGQAFVQSDGGASIDTEPDSWAVIVAIAGWACFVIAVAAAAAAFVAFSDWTQTVWPHILTALAI
jgi:hypothetical protein